MSVSRETPRELHLPESAGLALGDVSRETSVRLALYVHLLLRWNQRINLISAADEAAVWQRHIADSLQLTLLLPEVSRAIDLGSGAGLPGLVLAIATGIPFDLLESDSRKAAFLREAARETAAPATVHIGRIESTRIPAASLITARALAPLPKLLALAAPLLLPDGTCLFHKGASLHAELAEAAVTWKMTTEIHPSRIGGNGAILRISEVSRV